MPSSSPRVTAIRFGPRPHRSPWAGSDGWPPGGYRRATARRAAVCARRSRNRHCLQSPSDAARRPPAADGTARVLAGRHEQLVSVLADTTSSTTSTSARTACSSSPPGRMARRQSGAQDRRVDRRSPRARRARYRLRCSSLAGGAWRMRATDGTLRAAGTARAAAASVVRSFGQPVTSSASPATRSRRPPRTVKSTLSRRRGTSCRSAKRRLGRSRARPDGATVRIDGIQRSSPARRPRARPPRTLGLVTSAHFSPDGAERVTASRDDVPIVWDARRGVALPKLRGHFAVVSDAASAPTVVGSSPLPQSRLFDASTGELIYLRRATKALSCPRASTLRAGGS